MSKYASPLQGRRMERYRILYLPYIDPLGSRVNIPGLKQNGTQAIQTTRENSFQINGARLFNSLPIEQRNMKCYQEDL